MADENIDDRMATVPGEQQQLVDAKILSAQVDHWAATFAANPEMYGTEPSGPAVAADHTFTATGLSTVLEQGAAQGRDTLYLARQGLHVTALDYTGAEVADISTNARAVGLGDKIADPLFRTIALMVSATDV